MSDLQAQYDDAMFDYSTSEYPAAIAKLRAILDAQPDHFDAQLSIAMCHYRLGDFATAIAEGHKAERMRPNEQLVHTNLSLFYMKSGDKTTAEKHGLQARIASWKGNMAAPGSKPEEASDPELQMAQPKAQAFKMPEKFPDMPWKKNSRPGTPPSKPDAPMPPP
jgi:tetratricopeptide (TPR) repeat protein